MTNHLPASRVVAYAAGAWALIFGAFHLVWAAGSSVLLDPGFVASAYAQPSFVPACIAVAGLCVVAAVVAFHLSLPPARGSPRWLVGALAWGATGVLLLRSVASVVLLTRAIVTGGLPASIQLVWEPWFYLGAALFAVGTWRYWRATSPRIIAA